MLYAISMGRKLFDESRRAAASKLDAYLDGADIWPTCLNHVTIVTK